MSDHEFEKRVQQKLGELKLRPSNAVWTEVEKNIRQDKRRRRFIFWLPVFFFFLATSGYVLYRTNQPSAPIAQATPDAKTNTTSTSTNTIAHNDNNSTSTTSHSLPTTDTRSASAASETSLQHEQETVPGTKQQPVIASGPDKLWNIAAKKDNRSKRYKNKPAPVTPEQLPEDDQVEYSRTASTQPDELAITMPQTVPQGPAAIATGQAAPNPFTSRSAKLFMPEKQNSSTTLPVPPIQKQRAPKWQWGVQGSYGYSRISQSTLLDLRGLLGSADKNIAEDLAVNSTPQYNNLGANFIRVTPPPAEKEPAPIQPDQAYSVGLYVQRPLSKRLRITVGLQYAYMSAHTTVGKLIQKETNVNRGATGSILVKEYYTSKDYKDSGQAALNNTSFTAPRDSSSIAQKYTYRFHAVEIPVLINWQINKGRRLPPFVLDAGFSVLLLKKIDALHYDGVKDIYYKDNSLFNKTQFNAIAGLNVGLFQRSKFPVWIGPSLRYSLTGLVKKEVSKGQFLWSAGMNVRIGLNRLF